jgi:hypothetical protein
MTTTDQEHPMAAAGTYTQPVTLTVTIGDHSEVIGSGDLDIPITLTPCKSQPGTAGYKTNVDVKPALAKLLREAADGIEAE